MSRSYSAAFWRSLNESISRSVVQVSVFKGMVPVHLGTGIILCAGPNCIAILTTVTCAEVEKDDDEKRKDDDNEKKRDGYRVFVKFGDLKAKQALVFLSDKILSVLVLPLLDEDMEKILVLDNESFYETDICKSEPVWVVGCFSKALEQVMPAGYVSISDDENTVKGEFVSTFAHSCPIGDGLIGAPIINRFGKIIGLNVTPTAQSSKLNHALKFKSLRDELASLLDEEDYKKPMSSLVSMLRKQLIDFRCRMKSAKKKTDGASSSSATAN
ncbi:unnamed protein product [Urochloa decumbens]|uniref:Uncharacterized protein n=1 Tax=Urochloa decumbens TaxID=240449 RepID=A0ABC9G6V2_9POAL